MTKLAAAMVALSVLAHPAVAAAQTEELPELVLGDGEANDFFVSQQAFELVAGQEYRLPITAKGFKEYGFEAPEFFRNIWVRQVVIEDLEVKPAGLFTLEFDAPGTIELSFVPVRAGTYEWFIEGMEERGMHGEFVVKRAEGG